MKRLELLSIILSIATVGVGLGAVVIGSNANLRTELRTEMEALRVDTRNEVQELRTELHTEMRSLRKDVRADIAEVRADLRAVDGRLSALEQRQARTEGLLEGLRDAIAAQRLPDPREKKDAT